MPQTRRHIAYFSFDYPNSCAGPAVNARRLLPELHHRGHQVTALIWHSAGKRGHMAEHFRRHGIDCHESVRPSTTSDGIHWIARKVSRANPDVFVANTCTPAAYAGRWLRESGIATVAAQLSDDDVNWAIAEQFACLYPEWACSAIYCISKEIAGQLEKKNPHSQVFTIPNWVPAPEKQADQTRLKTLTYFGRLVNKQKRIVETMSAICQSLDDHPELTARIIGTGAQEGAAKQTVAERGMSSRIEFVGYVPPEQVYDEMVLGQVLVLLSDYEGQPGSALEAMACGLVPVCLDCPGGLREILRHEQTGLLVGDRDQEFRAAIDRLVGDHALRQSIAQCGRQYIQDNHSLRVTGDRWESLIESVCASAGPRSPIRIPRNLDLPEQHPGLGREDTRHAPLRQRIPGFIRSRLA